MNIHRLETTDTTTGRPLLGIAWHETSTYSTALIDSGLLFLSSTSKGKSVAARKETVRHSGQEYVLL
jgi:hypothetical protein